MDQAPQEAPVVAQQQQPITPAETATSADAKPAKPVKAKPEKPTKPEKPEESQDASGSKKKEKDKSKAKVIVSALKTPKGTQDFDPTQMALRQKVMGIIVDNFKKHGAVTIETPVFELKETLTGKYGEDSKLIYDLADQGGELCSLRYDLTVPFARYVAMNKLKQIKRYHIARVYRRDNPVMTKGRFREFYQCDFDIAGEYDPLIPDAECLKLLTEILDQLAVGPYKIKLNHRQLLDGFFAICGVPEDKFRAISSAVDKLDKAPWEEVRKEMIEVKGLLPEVADRIETFVKLAGPPQELWNEITQRGLCASNAVAQKALEDLRVLFDYLDCFGVLDKVWFDLSLARGLDYYTGIIFEAILVGDRERGSISAGGRYDGLVGLYSGHDIPSVGFSVGIERVFSLLEDKAKREGEVVRQTETEVLVCQADKGLLKDRMKIASELWANNIKAELVYKTNPRLPNQLDVANNAQVPIAIVLGMREVQNGTLQLKDLTSRAQKEVRREDVVAEVRALLQEIRSRPPAAPGAQPPAPVSAEAAPQQ